MENEKPTIDNNDFIRLPRSIKEFYLDRFLLLEEFIVLVWLWFGANPKTGRINVSYEGLSKDFQERYSKNQINKIMLELKRKRLIWYPRQQGRRSSFNVDIQNYPLSKGKPRDISELFNGNSGRSSGRSENNNPAEAPAEVETSWQKLKTEKKSLIKRFSTPFNDDSGRSYNNDNEKENYNKNRSSFNKIYDRVGLREFRAKSYEEQRCLEIARKIGETDMRFILSALKKYGFHAIERAYNDIKERPPGSIENKGAYFNELLKRSTEKNKST